jgi:lipoprotein-anchoring transpeptidase ErfK/SrfK
MKRLLMILFGVLTLTLIPNFAAQASETSNGDAAVLCLPGNYLFTVTDCMPNGPSAYQTEIAQIGISLPQPPLPVIKPDFELTYVNYYYGYVRTKNAPVYSSMEDALQNKRGNAIRKINSSFSYISYIDTQVVDDKRVYMIAPGEWMTANDVSRVTAPYFQGIKFSQTPYNAVGWILTYLSNNSIVETKRSPGVDADDYTGHTFNNHDLVWVYDETEANGMEWYRIGPDEWLPANVVARVIPNTTPPNGVNGDRWIEVNLYEQTIAVYDHNELVFATLIASGLDPFWTRPGLFQIYEKLDSTPMSGSFEADRSDAYYLEDVPWTMYFDEARAFHGAYWRANLGFPQSHGCVNLSIGDSRWLFDWAEVGDWVYVWDPSGKTPTDNSLYGEGGA